MGTRSEIVVWDGNSIVTLYKHWDGYPDYMVPMLEDAARFAAYMALTQRHWLTYAEDVASYLILYHGLVNLNQLRRRRDRIGINPDIRPAGAISDYVEYVYILRVNPDSGGKVAHWILEIFSVKDENGNMSFWDLSRKERDEAYLSYLRGGTKIPHLAFQKQVKIRIPARNLKKKVPIVVNVRVNNK
jgi:hypothetical protein